MILRENGLALALILSGLMAVALPARAERAGDDAARQLHALFQEEWEYPLREDPPFASFLGDRRYNDRWPDVSLAAVARRHQRNQEVLEKLDAIDRAALSEADRVNYQLFRRNYEFPVEGHQHRTYLLPVSHQGGIQTENELADALRFATVKDYEDWIAPLPAPPLSLGEITGPVEGGGRGGVGGG